MNLSPNLQRAVADMGFVHASPIQSRTIPLLLEGKDVVGQAQTGTGKTAAFGIPAIEKISPKNKFVSTVVLCPTRELAVQVSVELRKLAKHKKGVYILPIYGGASMHTQIQALRRGVHIVVGTPGRVLDHLKRGTLSFAKVDTMVLDEADEMLNMGFRQDIEAILKTTPRERQTVLFSATMPGPILEIARKHQNEPVFVKTTSENLTAASIEQIYVETNVAMKPAMVSTLMKEHDLKLTLIFCNTKRRVDTLTKALRDRGYNAAGIHGDYSQSRRNNVLAGFRRGDLNILVATDVAARGIDVSNIDGVFNYDIPLDPEYYVHRIGRTGRAGKTGKAFSIVTGRDELRRLRMIENYAKVKVVRKDVTIIKEPVIVTKPVVPVAPAPPAPTRFERKNGSTPPWKKYKPAFPKQAKKRSDYRKPVGR